LSRRLFYFRQVIVIADSGSTKTDWVVVDNSGEEICRTRTEGYNPMIVSSEFVEESIKKSDLTPLIPKVEKVYFYGAGCSSNDSIAVIEKALSNYFTQAQIVVHHDLLGAARAACGDDSGIVSILGTGSNSCLYLQGEVVRQVPNLGYLLGDEGGGYSLGRHLMKAYMYSEISDALCEKLEETYSITRSKFITQLYADDLKNRYVAGFAPFCFEHRKDQEIRRLIENNFNEFIVHHLLKYNVSAGLKFHFVGSIASYFGDDLNNCLSKHGLEIGEIVRQPIDAIVRYHIS
jgi:glucosamine kinase